MIYASSISLAQFDHGLFLVICQLVLLTAWRNPNSRQALKFLLCPYFLLFLYMGDFPLLKRFYVGID
jgi:hypothetical protein